MISEIKVDQLIPSHTETTTHYTCEVCKKEFEIRLDALRHYGKNHAIEERYSFAFEDCYDFDVLIVRSKEDLEAYAYSTTADYNDISWEGPGAYVCRMIQRPCSQGCCEKEWFSAFPVQKRIESLLVLQEECKNIIEILSNISDALEKLKSPR